MKHTVATRSELASIIHRLNKKDLIIFDTETTGLEAYQKSEMFSLAVCDGSECVYFNFKDYGNGFPTQYILEKSWLQPLMFKLRKWVAHNAKFDLHFTAQAGIQPFGPVFDTEVMARVYQNNFQYSGGYSLDACVKRWLGLEKDDRVKAYMDEHNLFHTVEEFGKEFKNYHFDQVPFELISEYAMKDAEITWALYTFLEDNMYYATGDVPNKALEIEKNLTPVLFHMERRGLLVDVNYCGAAYAFESGRAKGLATRITQEIGQEFIDSAKCLTPYFEKFGAVFPETEKGNKQITDEVLSSLNHSVANLILEYREAIKRATTYFQNYVAKADKNNVIHPSFRQAGTVTGRMSCTNPNLQNVPTDDNANFPIRRAFVPRPGFIYVSIDYAQMEFRLMLDYANQEDLIEKIKAGHDPHDATAELTGLERKAAKTLNFGIIYRMGLAKLGKTLGITEAAAGEFRKTYFGKMPKVKRFIYEAPRKQEERGYTYSWAGRRFYLDAGTNDDGSSKWSYKAANSIIQGGCADICKTAMVEIERFLEKHQTRMVLQVHDEILFEVHRSEIDLIPQLKQIMEKAYPAKFLPLTCSVAFSEKSFHDMTEVENVADIGAQLSKESFEATQNASESVVLQDSRPS